MAKNVFNPKFVKAKAPDVKNFPLFFKRPVALDSKRHANAGLLQLEDVSFAAATNSIVINTIEFFEAAKHYPIVFTTSDDFLPVAIVGLEQANYFVTSKGQWKEGAYIPAYVRKYPFIFMNVPERNEFTLCIDEASSQYKDNGGKGTSSLYKDGVPSALTRNALEFCTSYHNQHQLTRAFCKALQDAGLLMTMSSDTQLNNGRKIHLSGFRVIDEKKLNALPEDKIIKFFKKNLLPLIYSCLLSASNWKKLADMAAIYEQSNQ